MIKRIRIYETDCIDPYRNLATEKYLLEQVQPGECILYLWQNQNTVVIGRNQNAWAECRVSLLEQDGGTLARRLSGGGAVFHDLGNLNFTFVMEETDYDLQKQLSVIQTACHMMGIEAVPSGRNDLLVNGAKFSGNAFYHSQGKAYHHGTLLVNADMDKLSRYLSPPKAKLEAKGVASVRSRVTNLCQYAPELTCELLKQQMAAAFSQVYGLSPERVVLTEAAELSIAADAEINADWQWLYGAKLPFSFQCEEKFSWGYIQLQIQAEAGMIHAVKVYSDAMDWSLSVKLERALTGIRFTLPALRGAIQEIGFQESVCQDLCSMLERQAL